MRRLLYILLIACSSAWAQVQAPLQTFISGGVATGANHPSTSIPTHFSNFGQPFFLPRTENTQNGGGVGNASVLMFGPQVTSQAPAMNATNVSLNADLVLTFDAAIAKGTGDILIRQFPENSTWQPITVTTSDVEVDGATLTIHANNFPPNHVLYVIIPNGAIMDLAGNSFGGYSDDTGWKFTTGSSADTTPPTINGLFPPDNGISAPISDNMIISFSEPVVKGSGIINVRRSDDNSLLDQIDIATETSVSGTDVTIDPLDFPLLTDLYVTISAGGYLDLSGNAFAGISDSDQTSWNFTTVGDTSPPTVQSLLPADGSSNVSTNYNLQVTFSEQVIKGTGTITIRRPSDDLLIQSISLTDDVSINGSTVTINSPVDLPQNMYLYVSIPAGTFKDPFGNDFAGILDNTTWNFTTAADLTAPQVTSKNPAFAATGVAINTDLVLTFDEPVIKGTSGDIIIRRFSDNAALQAITVTTSQVIASGSTITIQTNDFPVLTELYVIIPTGAIKDPAGNAFAGYNDNTGWKFTTSSSADVTPPVVQTLSPLDDATGVAVNSDLSITFSENVTRAAGTITIRRVTDDAILQSLSLVNDVGINGSIVTINPPANLPFNTAVWVSIPSGTFEDLAGNDYAGITNLNTWNFATAADISPPLVQSFVPADDATGVAINSDLVVTFSETVQKAAGSITIRRVSNDAVVQTISLANDVVITGSTATINPPSDLPYNTALYVDIPAGTFEDLLGTDYAGTAVSTTWNFTTALDSSPPQVVSTTPTNGATGILVASNLTILFNEQIAKGTGTITIKRVSDNAIIQSLSLANDVSINASTVTINPPVNLPFNGTLYVSIPAGTFEDLAGNDFAGYSSPSSWSFTTELDTSAPLVTVKDPAMNAIDVPVNAILVLTFNEPIAKNSGTIEIRSFPANTVIQSIDVTSSNVQVTGNNVTINHGDFSANTDYYVFIPAGAIRDLAGNFFSGYSDATGWKFKTKAGTDPRGPQITGTVPPTGATGVATNGSLIVNFDEPVVKGTGVILLVRSIDNSIAETIDVSTGLVSVNGSTVIIHHTTTFPAGTALHVIISGTAFRDVNSNPSQGIYVPSVWNFTTAAGPDAAAPTASYTPTNGATGVLVGANLSMTFNEPVVTKSGNVFIKRLSDGATVHQLAATSFTGSGTTIITINPPADLAWNGTYFVTMGTDAFEDLAGNPFPGFSASNVWNFSTQLDPDGPVIGAVSPTLIELNVVIPIAVTITDTQSGVTGATIQYRTLGAPNLQPAEPMTLNTSTQKWEKTIAISFVKESGVEYIITATNGAGMTSSQAGLVRIDTDDGLRIPYSDWGSKEKNYRIVTVPMDLTHKSISEVFDELGDQKDKKWRVARYEGGKTIQDYSGSMEAGKGYWLIVKKDPGKPIFSGPGQTIEATSTLGKKITLKDGWNQIGNPYNFRIAWSDVTSLASNAAASLVLRTYPGSWTNGIKLDPMEGGFVFHTGADKELQIPAKKGARYKFESAELRNSIDQEDWEVYLNLEQGDMYNQISGVGMRSLASTGYDRFDGINMPRFENFLEVTHPKEIRGYTYSMDIVPSTESFIWDFSVETSLTEDKLSFTWDNTYFGPNDKELVLWDEDLQRPINMRVNPGYIFDRKRTKNFRVIFGDKEFIEEHTQVKRVVIHQVYPNPAAADLTVSLGLPAEEWVSVEVHDLLGRRLTTFFEGRLEKGHHDITWDRTGEEPNGLYLIVVKAGNELATEKVILK